MHLPGKQTQRSAEDSWFGTPTLQPSDEPLPEQVLNFARRMDEFVSTGARILLTLVMLAAVAQLIATLAQTELPLPVRVRRMGTGGVIFVLALVCWGIARRRGVRFGVALFCASAMLALLAAATLYGLGLHSSSMPGLVMLVVITALLVGPRATRWALAVSVIGVLGLGALEGLDIIPGLTEQNEPALASYVLVYAAALLISGWLLMRYGRLFWEITSTLEGSRQLLADSLRAQRSVAEDLRASEERLRKLLDSALISILVLDAETGALKFANSQTFSIYGCERLEQLDAQLMFPDKGYSRAAFMQRLRATCEHGAQYFEWRSARVDGQAIWWDMKMDLLRLQGERSVVLFAHDVSDRVRAENELQQHRLRLQDDVAARTAELSAEKQRMINIIEALPLTLSIRDLTGRYVLVNRVFEQFTGRSRDTVLGRSATEFYSAESVAQQAKVDADVLRGAKPLTNEEQLPQAGGDPLDLLLTTVPLRDQRGHAYGLLNLGVDVTPLKHLQRELSLSRDEAQALAHAKSEFLANMSHEIRTPLNAVLGLAQLAAKREGDTPASRADFQRILRAGNHLLGVINDILDYSKIESGKFELHPTPVRLALLLKNALDLVSERASTKGLTLRMDSQGVPAWALLDGLRVSQVLVNLLGNAVKFTASGDVLLRLSIDEGQLAFEVRDTGVGISEEQQLRIFAAFEQADSSTTRQFGGTGLGLSISRQLARLMGGYITVSSVLGQGSSFVLRLPLQAVDAPAVEPPPPTALAAAPAQRPLDGLRLLIVDDVDINREILDDLLRHAGAEVIQADSGAQALRLFKEQGPGAFDLVLMDVQMPDMDGYQATGLLHELQADLPVLAVTAHAMGEHRARSEAAGMVGHLSKPIQECELMQAVLRHARRQTRPVRHEPAPTETPALATPGTDWPQLAGADFPAALRRCADRAELLRRLLLAFVKQYGRHHSLFEEAGVAGPSSLRAAAHRLKGVAGNLGMDALAAQAGRLEDALRADAPEQQALLQGLHAQLADALQAIRDWDPNAE